ncbi:MAG: hypothetical protein JO062_12330 [Bryobacterales bacterium]|nr:hypothetical protein [Bryobacterales bacterium]
MKRGSQDAAPKVSRLISRANWKAWLIGGASLFAIYLAARIGNPYIADPAHSRTLSDVAMPLFDPSTRDIFEWIAAALCLGIVLTFPRFRAHWLVQMENKVSTFANHRRRAIVFCALFPVLIRLALLPILGVPEPIIADEFGYLLLANTFASGRLTNPTHPLWRFFEGIYVLQQPTYTSIYPIASAILLAIPEIIGVTPWVGVCLTVALMCGTICWMLQAWVPPKWAFLGGLLAGWRFGIFSPWMNNYWGGATAALGGALLLGALPRIIRRPRVRDALLFGLGLAILAQSRPYEGLLFAIPLIVWLLVWLIRSRDVSARLRLSNVFPLAAAVTLLAAGTAIYNWRVTGNAFRMPYVIHQKIYGTPQRFYWQPAIIDAPGIHRQKDIEDVFHWQLDAHEGRLPQNGEAARLKVFWDFYFQPLLTVPLVFLAFLWRNARLRIALLAGAAVLAGGSLYPFFFPHYAAPLCALTVLLAVLGLRCLRAVRIRAYRAGACASRVLVLLIGLSGLPTMLAGILAPWLVAATDTPRHQVAQYLKTGKHVVLVRYSDRHSFHNGIVFNEANIDKSQTIWARDMGDENKELIQYYPDRQFWLYNPDNAPDQLVPFDRPIISAIANAAGRREDLRIGVSPGGIAVLMGANFVPGLHGTAGSSLLGTLPVHLANVSTEYGEEFAPGSASSATALQGNLAIQFAGRPADVIGVSEFGGHQAITLQIPPDVPAGPVPVSIRAGKWVFDKQVQVLPATPGIFQLRMSDSKLRGIVMRAGGSLVDLEHPAHRGDTLRLFATGLGPVSQQLLFLSWRHPPAHLNGLGVVAADSEPTQQLIVKVADRGARMISAKYATAMKGVVEISFEIPRDTPPGQDVPLSAGVVVEGETIYSNKSSLPIE